MMYHTMGKRKHSFKLVNFFFIILFIVCLYDFFVPCLPKKLHLFIYVFKTKSYKEKVLGNLPAAGSLILWPKQGLTRLKAGVRTLFETHGCRGSNLWAICHCFPGMLTGSPPFILISSKAYKA